ncbi:MAG: hypothetical protein KGS45_02435 [Planctomycetes bacterium]|nr:hypothetical protein [Planctomycetota bacterium]
MNVPIEGTYLAFTTRTAFSQLTVNADSGFECVDDVVIGDAVNMPDADHCVAAPLMNYTPGFTIPHPFSTIHTGADLINWFPPGNPNFPANRDIWYRWIAPETGTVVFSTVDPTTTFDTVLAVYDNTFGSCPFSNQNPVAFNDDAVGLRSSITMRVGSGSLFYVRLGGYNGATGSGTLNLSFVADCPADVNHDQVVDFFDYLDFVSAFSVPCP